MPWAAEISSTELEFTGDGWTVERPGIGGDRAAALVPVPRESSFELAVVVEQMPKSGYPFYFGIGRAMPPDGAHFGLYSGTCGLRQHGWIENSRVALSKGFGTRTDRDDAELGPSITAGTRLALQLSPVGADHYRTLRFFADHTECATFRWIHDNAKTKPWVAGCNPSEGALVRIVPAERTEVWTEESGRRHTDAYGQALHSENIRQLSLALDGDLASQLQRIESATIKYECAVSQAEADIELKHKAAEQLSYSPVECETNLRKELQQDFDVDTWPTCGKPWGQCQKECKASGKECEQCKQGGNLIQMHAACRAYNAALATQSETGAGYPEEYIDDLVAARVFTRRQPIAVCDAVDAAARCMKEPGLPAVHRSMFVHLRRACFELQGAGQHEQLYRQQLQLDGESKPNLDPQDPQQYEEGTIVQWRGFTLVSRGPIKETAVTRQHQESGVLFVLEPPHACDNLGANLTHSINGSPTLAVSAGLSPAAEQDSNTLTEADYAFDATDSAAASEQQLAVPTADGSTTEATDRSDKALTQEPGSVDGAEADPETANDQILLPPGCAFRVLSVELDEDNGRVRVVRLKHLGAWVTEGTYAMPQISMGQVRTSTLV